MLGFYAVGKLWNQKRNISSGDWKGIFPIWLSLAAKTLWKVKDLEMSSIECPCQIKEARLSVNEVQGTVGNDLFSGTERPLSTPMCTMCFICESNVYLCAIRVLWLNLEVISLFLLLVCIPLGILQQCVAGNQSTRQGSLVHLCVCISTKLDDRVPWDALKGYPCLIQARTPAQSQTCSQSLEEFSRPAHCLAHSGT